MTKIKPFVEREPKITGGPGMHENPVLDRIYRNRGVGQAQDIDYALSGLLSPWTMKGMDQAADVIIRHIMRQSRILIVGDYDCDGATATTIGVEGLGLLGAKNVSFLVPDRMKHGYGLSPAVVDVAAEFKPELIITVDNGISSFEGAQAVRDLPFPCDLVITDHHLASDRGIPEAQAVVNPNQPGCEFESKAIAGCGVMFYTIMALRARMRDQGLFDKLGMEEPKLSGLLDVLALGTVADVVPLDKNNRILVSTGLGAINQGAIRPGLRFLLELGKRRIGDIVTQDMGFAAGPRINAAGRLDDMTLGIKCLLTRDEAEAAELAETLDSFNQQRKEMESEMVEEAVQSYEGFTTDNYGVCLMEPNWHEGVIGIVASRIKDRLSRPVICFSYSEPAREVYQEIKIAKEANNQALVDQLERELGELDMKGSARSVPGVHLKHDLDRISKTNPDILVKFGGHAMAAGMSIKIKYFEEFKRLFDAEVRKELTAEMIKGRVDVDIKDINPDWINIETAELLRHVEPWGQHFESPLFSAKFDVVETRVLQDKHLKMVVRATGTQKTFDAIAFNCVEKGELPVGESMEASFTMDINEWRGKRNLQLLVGHLQDEGLDLRKKMAEKEKGGNTVVPGAGRVTINSGTKIPQPEGGLNPGF